MSVVWLFICAAVMAAGQSWFFRLLGMRRVRYSRTFSRPAAFAGERADMVEVLENRGRLPVPWLRAESRVPAQLRFGAASLSEINGQMYHQSLFFLPPMSRITRRHHVTLSARGVYRAGSVALSAGDLLGISAAFEQLETGAQIVVYPRLVSDDDIPLPCSRFIGELLTRRFLRPDPCLFAGVRAYQPGDPAREVHWGASARMDELMVKTFDYSAEPRLMIVFNVQLGERQWGALNEEQMAVVERGLSLAASLMMRVMDAGASAGFCANTDTLTPGERAYLPPVTGQGRKAEALSFLARLTLKMRMNFYAYLKELQTDADDILVLSCADSRRIREQIDRLRSEGRNVAFYRMPGGWNDDE